MTAGLLEMERVSGGAVKACSHKLGNLCEMGKLLEMHT